MSDRDNREVVYLTKEGGTQMKTIPIISEQERTRREEAVRFARNSVALEGFHLSPDAEAVFARYICGEINRAQLNAIVLKKAHASTTQ